MLAISLPVQLLLINWAAANPQWVERWYSRGIYPFISRFFRMLYGWIPFSVGDLLYALLIAVSIAWFVRRGYRIRARFSSFLRDIVAILAVIHLTFYLLWGLNYFRAPLGQALGFEETYSPAELIHASELLAGRANKLQLELTGDTIAPVQVPHSQPDIRRMTVRAYEKLASTYPDLAYKSPSLKNSLFGTALTYMGYGGYLNPFTGEAQVNGRLPAFRYPVVAGHEAGHQLGYSAENETNFIGYLVTEQDNDPYFQYAAAAFGLSYCLAEVNKRDSLERKRIVGMLHPGVRANYKELQEFWEAYQNPLEPVFKSVFNRYLEANRQKDGIASYNRIVALLVAHLRREAAYRELPGGQRP